ncbi:hypothetical protein ACV0PV_001960 [Pseudomonas aeruginosa]
MTPSKIQMDQIRSTSATVKGENIRAGSQKKSSLSQAEGLQGASPDATCTCPSGDGSLVHPCPAHPASVEQAGGDERVIGWRERILAAHPNSEDALLVEHMAAEIADLRAALAQPSPVSEALIYACKNLAQITSSDGSGHADIALAVLRMAGVGDDERERLVNEWKAARAWKPSPAQAEQAEAERPIVSFEKYMQVMYDRDENAKRLDAALARVAELELKLDQSDYAYDNERHHMRGMAKQAAEAIQVFTGHDSGANLAHRYGEKWWEHLD